MSSHQELPVILESPNQVSSILDAGGRDGGLMGLRVSWAGSRQELSFGWVSCRSSLVALTITPLLRTVVREIVIKASLDSLVNEPLSQNHSIGCAAGGEWNLVAGPAHTGGKGACSTAESSPEPGAGCHCTQGCVCYPVSLGPFPEKGMVDNPRA